MGILRVVARAQDDGLAVVLKQLDVGDLGLFPAGFAIRDAIVTVARAEVLRDAHHVLADQMTVRILQFPHVGAGRFAGAGDEVNDGAGVGGEEEERAVHPGAALEVLRGLFQADSLDVGGGAVDVGFQLFAGIQVSEAASVAVAGRLRRGRHSQQHEQQGRHDDECYRAVQSNLHGKSPFYSGKKSGDDGDGSSWF